MKILLIGLFECVKNRVRHRHVYIKLRLWDLTKTCSILNAIKFSVVPRVSQFLNVHLYPLVELIYNVLLVRNIWFTRTGVHQFNNRSPSRIRYFESLNYWVVNIHQLKQGLLPRDAIIYYKSLLRLRKISNSILCQQFLLILFVFLRQRASPSVCIYIAAIVGQLYRLIQLMMFL